VNGWAATAAGYWKSNALENVSTNPLPAGKSLEQINGYYVSSISSNIPYIVTCTGYYPMPTTSAFLSRTIQVTTKNLGVYFAPLVVKDQIELNGNNVMTDSYDSTNPSKSTGGRYDPAKAQDKGDVASINGLSDTLAIGNANIWGHVLTGPSGNVTVGPSGAVGDVAWQRAGKSGLESGWWLNDLNFSMPDVQLPFTNAPPPASGTVATVSYNTVLPTGNFKMSSLAGNVIVTGNAVLYVTDDIKFSSSDTLTILPGFTLQIYSGAASATFGGIDNKNTDPMSFQYFGLNSNTSIGVKGQNPWTGVIYAPYAQFTLNGNGVLYGSVVAKSAKLSGNAAVHYDESLLNKLPTRGFVATSWTEL
jgi:hypothetical protein